MLLAKVLQKRSVRRNRSKKEARAAAAAAAVGGGDVNPRTTTGSEALQASDKTIELEDVCLAFEEVLPFVPPHRSGATSSVRSSRDAGADSNGGRGGGGGRNNNRTFGGSSSDDACNSCGVDFHEGRVAIFDDNSVQLCLGCSQSANGAAEGGRASTSTRHHLTRFVPPCAQILVQQWRSVAAKRARSVGA